MVPAQRRQLPSALVVLDQKSRPEKKWLSNLAHRAGRQPEPGGDYVQAAVTLGQDAEVLLFHRPQAQFVNLLQATGSLQVGQGDCPFSSRTADPSGRLEQAQGQPGCATGTLGYVGKDALIDRPVQCPAPLPKQNCQLLVRVELEAKQELHPIPQRLQEAVFVGCAEQQREVAKRHALHLARPALDEQLAALDGPIEGRLVLLLQLMSFVEMED